MKFAVFLAILSLALTSRVVYAAEEMPSESESVSVSESENIAAYCTEQAELSGIEDAGEKAQYLKECIDSFAVPSEESQQ